MVNQIINKFNKIKYNTNVPHKHLLKNNLRRKYIINFNDFENGKITIMFNPLL